jgi:hypothetical protein
MASGPGNPSFQHRRARPLADDRRQPDGQAGAGDPSVLIPFFEKARWLDVVPGYNPFKYPVSAGAAQQSYASRRRSPPELPTPGPAAPRPPADPRVPVDRRRDGDRQALRDLFDQPWRMHGR